MITNFDEDNLLRNFRSIDHHIPLPYTANGRPASHPYRVLPIGASFFLPDRDCLNTSHWQKATGFKFTTRKVTESGVTGIRVWRIA